SSVIVISSSSNCLTGPSLGASASLADATAGASVAAAPPRKLACKNRLRFGVIVGRLPFTRWSLLVTTPPPLWHGLLNVPPAWTEGLHFGASGDLRSAAVARSGDRATTGFVTALQKNKRLGRRKEMFSPTASRRAESAAVVSPTASPRAGPGSSDRRRSRTV